MKTSISVLLALSMMGCTTATPSRDDVGGGYIHGAQKIYLTVRHDGTYSAGLGSCRGTDGIADGTWRIVGRQITFSPTNETKQIRGLLRKADIVKDGQYWALVRPTDRKLVQTKGISFESCLKNTADLE